MLWKYTICTINSMVFIEMSFVEHSSMTVCDNVKLTCFFFYWYLTIDLFSLLNKTRWAKIHDICLNIWPLQVVHYFSVGGYENWLLALHAKESLERWDFYCFHEIYLLSSEKLKPIIDLLTVQNYLFLVKGVLVRDIWLHLWCQRQIAGFMFIYIFTTWLMIMFICMFYDFICDDMQQELRPCSRTRIICQLLLWLNFIWILK